MSRKRLELPHLLQGGPLARLGVERIRTIRISDEERVLASEIRLQVMTHAVAGDLERFITDKDEPCVLPRAGNAVLVETLVANSPEESLRYRRGAVGVPQHAVRAGNIVAVLRLLDLAVVVDILAGGYVEGQFAGRTSDDNRAIARDSLDGMRIPTGRSLPERLVVV